jgi:hypothetical protein
MNLTAGDFDKRANSESEWLFVADDLFAATRFLSEHSYHLSPSWGNIQDHFPSFEELRITPVILMLRSMAIECLLKGIYAKFCGRLSASGKYKGIPGTRDHDLVALAKTISQKRDLHLSPSELDFIDRLSKNLVRGRYPVHKTWAQELLPHAGGDRRRMQGLMVPDHDDDLFQTVWQRLRELLKDEARAMYGDLEA